MNNDHEGSSGSKSLASKSSRKSFVSLPSIKFGGLLGKKSKTKKKTQVNEQKRHSNNASSSTPVSSPLQETVLDNHNRPYNSVVSFREPTFEGTSLSNKPEAKKKKGFKLKFKVPAVLGGKKKKSKSADDGSAYEEPDFSGFQHLFGGDSDKVEGGDEKSPLLGPRLSGVSGKDNNVMTVAGEETLRVEAMKVQTWHDLDVLTSQGLALFVQRQRAHDRWRRTHRLIDEFEASKLDAFWDDLGKADLSSGGKLSDGAPIIPLDTVVSVLKKHDQIWSLLEDDRSILLAAMAGVAHSARLNITRIQRVKDLESEFDNWIVAEEKQVLSLGGHEGTFDRNLDIYRFLENRFDRIATLVEASAQRKYNHITETCRELRYRLIQSIDRAFSILDSTIQGEAANWLYDTNCMGQANTVSGIAQSIKRQWMQKCRRDIDQDVELQRLLGKLAPTVASGRIITSLNEHLAERFRLAAISVDLGTAVLHSDALLSIQNQRNNTKAIIEMHLKLLWVEEHNAAVKAFSEKVNTWTSNLPANESSLDEFLERLDDHMRELFDVNRPVVEDKHSKTEKTEKLDHNDKETKKAIGAERSLLEKDRTALLRERSTFESEKAVFIKTVEKNTAAELTEREKLGKQKETLSELHKAEKHRRQAEDDLAAAKRTIERLELLNIDSKARAMELEKRLKALERATKHSKSIRRGSPEESSESDHGSFSFSRDSDVTGKSKKKLKAWPSSVMGGISKLKPKMTRSNRKSSVAAGSVRHELSSNDLDEEDGLIVKSQSPYSLNRDSSFTDSFESKRTVRQGVADKPQGAQHAAIANLTALPLAADNPIDGYKGIGTVNTAPMNAVPLNAKPILKKQQSSISVGHRIEFDDEEGSSKTRTRFTPPADNQYVRSPTIYAAASNRGDPYEGSSDDDPLRHYRAKSLLNRPTDAMSTISTTSRGNWKFLKFKLPGGKQAHQKQRSAGAVLESP